MKDDQHNAFKTSFDDFFKKKGYRNEDYYRCHESYFAGIDHFREAILLHAKLKLRRRELGKLLDSCVPAIDKNK